MAVSLLKEEHMLRFQSPGTDLGTPGITLTPLVLSGVVALGEEATTVTSFFFAAVSSASILRCGARSIPNA
jgi:hypothetical protein